MNDLLAQVIAAHGGLGRWDTFKRVTATVVTGGGLWPMKGLEQDPNPREETVTLHEEIASVSPFGQPDWHTAFTPDRIAIETTTGAVVSKRLDPRASLAGHVMNTPWAPLQSAYFNGYAMWTYLATPFPLAMPGFKVAEISPWQEGGEFWRGLRAQFPDAVASHSKEQDFYFGDEFPPASARLPRRCGGRLSDGALCLRHGGGRGAALSDQAPCLRAWARSETDSRPADGLDRSESFPAHDLTTNNTPRP